MKLVDDLRRAAAAEQSLFAAQLLKEDIARLEKLAELAGTSSDDGDTRKQAMTLGWTPGDLRTFELNPELAAFLDAVLAKPQDDNVVEAAWKAFNKRRIDLLVGCLSRPRID